MRIQENQILEASLESPEGGMEIVWAIADLAMDNYDEIDVLFATERAFPNAAVPVATAMTYWMRQGVRFRLNTPTHVHESLRPIEDYSPDHTSDVLNHVWVFDSNVDHTLVTDLIESLRIETACQEGVLAALNWAVFEVADNVFAHSGENRGLFMAQVHGRGRYIAISIGDWGRGIADSLRSVDPNLLPIEAIELATQEGVSSKEAKRGNGLWGLRNIVKLNEGRLTITSSGAGAYFHNKYENPLFRIPWVAPDHPGTFVDFQLNTGVPIDLPRALGGHEPINLWLEERTDEAGVVAIDVRDATASFGLREGGHELATYVLNVLREGASAVVLDFNDVEMMSSSVADELVRRLIDNLGWDDFRTRITIRGANPDISSLIGRATRMHI